MPIHLRAQLGDYAPQVLCPGDPLRATLIAEKFFDPGARCVNRERGLLGYTGTFEGRPISVQATGMGCPSAGIVFEELVMLGARRLIRVGTCGGLSEGMSMGDTVIASSATADDSTPLRYVGVDGFAPTATWSLVATASSLASSSLPAVHIGPVVTSGLFYEPDTTAFERWRRTAHVAVEMEAAMLYAVAAVKGVEALAVMTVSDLLGDLSSRERISDDALAHAVNAMMTVACRVAIS